MTLINFGIDFGNGYIKAKSEKVELVFSSKIGYASDLGTSSLSDSFGDEKRGYDYHIYQRKDEQKYVAGKDVERVIQPSKIIPTNSRNNRYDLESFKRIVDFAICELASYEDEENIDVRIVSGLPSDEFRMSEKKNAFEKYLMGNHLVTRNGIDHVINVKELKLIEQPLGTLLNVYLNDDLQVHKDFVNGLVVVIDFGSGTTIIDIYSNMRRVGGKTMPNGMIQFHKTIAEELSENLSIDVDRQYIENGIRNRSFVAELGTQAFNFKEIFNKHLEQKLESVIQAYEDEIDQEALVNDFILTGGGSLTLGEEITKMKSNFRVVEQPQTSTVNGYLKLAKSLGKDE